MAAVYMDLISTVLILTVEAKAIKPIRFKFTEQLPSALRVPWVVFLYQVLSSHDAILTFALPLMLPLR
jgi:hypothetical protein